MSTRDREIRNSWMWILAAAFVYVMFRLLELTP